jgi:hypothetical protein
VATAISTALLLALLLALLWPTATGSAASKYVARGRGAHDLAQTQAVAAQIARRTVATTLLLALAAVPLMIGLDGGDLSEAACVAVLVVGYCVYSFNRGLQFGAGQAARATGWHLISACSGLTGLLVVFLAGDRGPALRLPLTSVYGRLSTVAGWPHVARGRPGAALRRELLLLRKGQT